MKIKKQVEFARMWPREVFDCLIPEGKRTSRKQLSELGLQLLDEPGIYILYRDDVPYYVGQSTRLVDRLDVHAIDHGTLHSNFWNFFSVFVIEDAIDRDIVEGILIAAMPTTNGAKTRKLRITRTLFPESVKKMVKNMRRYGANLEISSSRHKYVAPTSRRGWT